MKILPLRPLPMQLEPLTDYLERLAQANGYHGKELWSILDRCGEPHEKILSDALNGFPLPEFSGPADRYIDIQVNQFGLKAADFTRFPHRWCPHCIDAQPWFRPVWRLKAAAVCAAHGVRLLETCSSCNRHVSIPAILRGTCECGVRFVDFAVSVAGRHVRLANALETSLSGSALLRLETTAVGMTTPELVRMICYVGRLREGPTLSRPGKLAGLGGIDVSFSVFDGAATILDNWPSTFWHYLERCIEASPDDASVRRVFGSLYQVIYRALRCSANQFLRDAFEAFLLDHWRGELCGRHRLFGKDTITANSRHGLARVARAHNIGGRTLRRMVHQAWLPANCFISSPKRQLITIDEKDLSAFIPDPRDYLDLRSAARFLGIKRSRLRELVGLGAIKADSLPTWRLRNQWYFHRTHVHEFLEEIRHAAAHTIDARKSITLSQVLQYWHVTTSELTALLSAMKKNQVPFALSTSEQLRHVTFNEDLLRSWLQEHRYEEIDWVSIPKAAEMLGLKQEVVYGLVAKNFLAAKLHGSRVRMTRRISLASVEKFKDEYVSLAEVARHYKLSSSTILKQLNIRPITGPRIDGSRQYFLRRNDISVLPHA